MELVYLWVKKYKNIKEQGFNFSPRFSCEYDEDANELTICDKKKKECKDNDYIENFFGDNINVTAIVGKNGSGKSSLLEQFIQTNEKSIFHMSNSVGTNYKITSSDLEEKYNIILYDDIPDSSNKKNKFNINEQVKIQNRYIFNNVSISLLVDIEKLDYIDELDFVPTHVELQMIDKDIGIENLIGHHMTYIDDYLDARQYSQINSSNIYDLKKLIEKELILAIEQTNITYYLYLREFIYRITQGDIIAIKLVERIILKYYDENKSFEDELKVYFIKLLKDNVFSLIVKSINTIKKDINEKNIVIELKEKGLREILINIDRGFFQIEFYKYIDEINRLYFSDLSTGEQKLLLIFAKIFYIFRKNHKENNKEIILLMDEPDIYMHPQWQKKFILYLINFIQNTQVLKEKKFNVIITTHSPFLISDFPKQNIIFLNDGKQVQGTEKKQTFGANIHTLLSDSFFMEDGLMGEFAKRKIDKVIQILNKQKPNKEDLEYCENIIPIIGEPIVKNQLQKMLDSKKLPKVGEIDKIHEEIEALQNRLKDLE